ncbi:MAG TPA: protein kinase [Gemmatimonadaceae bacterium]|nr:protein kinase [Gemmatimonadaceae bacterium]
MAFTTDTLTTALADRYAIERQIGEGGMARVFLARDLRHNRSVALKVLRPDLGAVVGVDRFQAEIEVTANLQHPNLLPLFDSGIAGDLLFYVMPYVEGESLRARLEREKQLPVDEAVRIATAVAGALDYAHRHGVIHRDLKPENILLQEGQPLVADFGIALAISNAGGARITQTGLSLGTPQYMSPEQATGDRAIDARTDIYSLGAVTYEMLTGEPPHIGSTAQAIIARVLTERPRSVRTTRPSVPEHVDAVVDKALEKLPADRWATARDFAEALTGMRQVVRTTSTLPAGGGGARSPVRRTARAREVVGWTLAATFAALSAWFGLRATRPVSAAASAEFDVSLPEGFALPISGAAASIALSRDGRTLVFVGQAKGATHHMLYSRRVGERYVQEIRGTEDALSPVFAPDGKEVVFALRHAGGGGIVKRIDVAGGVARSLIDSGTANGQLSWREGSQIVTTAADGGLALVNSETGTSSVLTRPDSMHTLGFPDVLPGGRAALIIIRPTNAGLDSSMIGVVTIPGGKVTSLGIHGMAPHYSPTGHIVYATVMQLLEAVPFDARALRVTGPPVVLATNVGGGSGGAVPFAVADNGTLAFIQGRSTILGQVQPVIVNRAGERRFLGVAPGVYASPRVSPDGKQIAYAAGQALNAAELLGSDIWRMDVATGRTLRVTSSRSSDHPVWSRDGAEIYFSRGVVDRNEYVIALTPGAEPRIVFQAPGRLYAVDVGPAHGRMMLGLGGPTSLDLWVAPMDSMDKPAVFAAGPYREATPRLSPDGRFVAYESARSGANEIYVRPVTGNGEDVKVSTGGGIDPVWSPNGRELFFVTGIGSGEGSGSPTAQMMAAQVATSPRIAVTGVRPLFPMRQYMTMLGRPSYDVFPNGDFLLLAMQSDSTTSRSVPLVVRTNWASSLGERGGGRTP